MTAKKHSTKPIEESSSTDYWIKAREFYAAMEQCYSENQWNAVGLNAVHALISAGDALLAKFAGIRNTCENHRRAADVLIQHIPHKDVDHYANHFRKVLVLKNVIEYEQRLVTRKEAEEMIKHTDRFFDWAKGLLAS